MARVGGGAKSEGEGTAADPVALPPVAAESEEKDLVVAAARRVADKELGVIIGRLLPPAVVPLPLSAW